MILQESQTPLSSLSQFTSVGVPFQELKLRIEHMNLAALSLIVGK